MAGIMLAPLFTACSKDNLNSDVQELNLTGTATTQEVQILASDLVGTWNMYSMTSVAFQDQSAVQVDFDQNGQYTFDLLEETECFDPMYFIFNANSGVDTHQSRLFFSEATGMFSCQTTGDYSATYEIVDGNELTITFSIDGQQYVETRTISLFSKDNAEFLKVTLTKSETNAAVYVAPDPGNTVASEIQKIEMVYIKQ